MKKIEINEHPRDFLKVLASGLRGEHTKYHGQEIVYFDNELGKGSVTMIYLKGGIQFFQYNVFFNKDVSINIHLRSTRPFYFIYSYEGGLNYQFDNNDKEIKTLEEFQTGLFFTNRDKEISLFFKKNIKCQFSITRVFHTRVKNHNLQDLTWFYKSKKMFSALDYEVFFMRKAPCNRQIAKYIKDLEILENNDLAGRIMKEGIIHIILSLKIRQFSEVEDSSNIQSSTLNKIKCSTQKNTGFASKRNIPERRVQF